MSKLSTDRLSRKCTDWESNSSTLTYHLNYQTPTKLWCQLLDANESSIFVSKEARSLNWNIKREYKEYSQWDVIDWSPHWDKALTSAQTASLHSSAVVALAEHDEQQTRLISSTIHLFYHYCLMLCYSKHFYYFFSYFL